MKRHHPFAFSFRSGLHYLMVVAILCLASPLAPCLAQGGDKNQDDDNANQAVTLTLEAKQLEGMTQEDKDKGVVLAFNNDRDDFNPLNENTYDRDWQKSPITGEDDLQELTLRVKFKDQGAKDDAVAKKQAIRLEITGNEASRLKVWFKDDKSSINYKKWNPDKQPAPGFDEGPKSFLLDAGPASETWYVDKEVEGTEFEKTIYVEGVAASTAIQNSEIKLTYLDQNGQVLGDAKSVEYSVVALTMDNHASYLPTFDSTINLQLGPVNQSIVGDGEDKVLLTVPDKKQGEGKDVTYLRGITMNKGGNNSFDYSGPDYYFKTDAETEDKKKPTLSINVNVPQEGAPPVSSRVLFCRDFGGRCRIVAEVRRGDVLLCRPEIEIPLDTDGDWLPDAWEDKESDDLTQMVKKDTWRNQVIFNSRAYNTITQVTAISAHSPQATNDNGNDRDYDMETQKTVYNGVTYEAEGTPAKGRFGDGLTAWEEYRGFVIQGQHRRTSPHLKDVFAYSDVFAYTEVFDPDNPPRNFGIGLLAAAGPATAPNKQLNIWDITDYPQEWSGVVERIVNPNRFDGDVESEGTAPQRGVYVSSKYINDPALQTDNFIDLMTPFIGYTRGGINTGKNGIRQTTNVAETDYPVIEYGHGLRNAITITPGLNGIIDPYYDDRDSLTYDEDEKVWKIEAKAGQDRLWTLSDRFKNGEEEGYWPQGDDRVLGRIEGGPNGLHTKTIAEARTPNNPDEDKRGDDVVVGNSIQPGANGVLDSRNYDDDYVVGLIDGGPPNPQQPDKVRKLDPLLNQSNRPAHQTFTGEKAAVAGASQASDDYWDADLNVIRTGHVEFEMVMINGKWVVKRDQNGNPIITRDDDGVSNTARVAKGDDIQVIPPGQGQPYALCIDTDNRQAHTTSAGFKLANTVETAGGGDDVKFDPEGEQDNLDPNQTAAGYVAVKNMLVNSPFIYVNIRTLADGRRVGDRAPFEPNQQQYELIAPEIIKLVTGHEAGHALHVAHWGKIVKDVVEDSPGTDEIEETDFNAASLAAFSTKYGLPVVHNLPQDSIMYTPLSQPLATDYDAVDEMQFRVHTKHD